MRIIRTCRIHKAVLWKRLGDTGRGYYAYDKPVQISCRWDGTDEQLFDDKGVAFKSTATLIVDRDVKVGDILLYGLLVDVKADLTDPSAIPDAGVARKVEKICELRNSDMTDFDRMACFVYLGQ